MQVGSAAWRSPASAPPAPPAPSRFNAATQTLTYTAPAYNPLNPTSDSFTYSVSDGHGGTATGTIAVTEQPAPSTTYATTAGATYTATASSWTMVSLATGQSLKGYSGGGDGFLLDTDTAVYAVGNGNTIAAGDGNFYYRRRGKQRPRHPR